MISLQALIGLSIVLTIIVSLIRFAFWILWPRKVEFDPYAQPHGDVPHDGRRS
jgi:hypothetical protein